MGIYHDLITIVSNPFKRFKQNVLFCLPLGIGAALSAVLFVTAFKFLFDTYEKATYFLFVGLIAGNLPVIYAQIKSHKFKKRYLAVGITAFSAALALGILATGIGQISKTEGITSGWHVLAASGFAAGVSALIPGMSVSVILIIMGVYSQLIFAAESLTHMQSTYLPHIGVFCGCAVFGLVLASRVIKTVFERFPIFANSAVFGFMLGSLTGILVQSLQVNNSKLDWVFGVLMIIIGLVSSMIFVVLGKEVGG